MQKKPVYGNCGCINFIITHQILQISANRQIDVFGHELSIDKLTTRNIYIYIYIYRKYYNSSNANGMFIKNFAEQYYSNKYKKTNLNHAFLHYFLKFRVP